MAVQSTKKSAALPWPALVPMGHHAGKPPIPLQKMVMLVGSRHNAHLHLLSRHVSKAHALILSYGGSVYIRDLASREQVYVNGVPQRESWLKNGDLLKIGSFTFKYKDGPTKGGRPDQPPYDADLEITGADAPLSIAEKVMLIGRRQTCDVSLIEASASTAHAVIFHVAGKRYVRDLGSRTGTFVNGIKVHQQELNPGDEIRIGETDMRFTRAADHEHHIAPVDAATAGGGVAAAEIDELEDLVGTAPLDMAAEIAQDGESVTSDVPYEVPGEPEPAAEEGALGADDLIALEIDPPAPPAPRPQPVAPPVVADPVMDDGLELLDEAPADAPVDAIDLSQDPDVADLPAASTSSSDTRSIGFDLEPAAPKPTVSERVVDAPVGDLAGGVAPERPEVDAEAETGAAADEIEATWPDDLAPLGGAGESTSSSAAPLMDISPRGGWQGMSRAEAEAAPPTEDEPLDELEPLAPVADAGVEELAPTGPVEEEPVADADAPAGAPAEDRLEDLIEIEPAPAPEAVVEDRLEDLIDIEPAPVAEAPVEAPAVESPLDVVDVEEAPAGAPASEVVAEQPVVEEATFDGATVEEASASGTEDAAADLADRLASDEPAAEAPIAPVDETPIAPVDEAPAAAIAPVGEAPPQGKKAREPRAKKGKKERPKRTPPTRAGGGAAEPIAPLADLSAAAGAAVTAGGAAAADEAAPVDHVEAVEASATTDESISQTPAPVDVVDAQVAGDVLPPVEEAASVTGAPAPAAEVPDKGPAPAELGIVSVDALSVVENEAIDQARLVAALNAKGPAPAPTEAVAPEPQAIEQVEQSEAIRAAVEEAGPDEAALPGATAGDAVTPAGEAVEDDLSIVSEALEEIALSADETTAAAGAEPAPPAQASTEAPEALAQLESAEAPEVEDVVELEAVEEVVEPAVESAPVVAEHVPAADAHVPDAEAEEELEPLALVEEDEPAAPQSPAPTPKPVEEDTLPLLDFESAEFEPMQSRRDPDALLALDQVDPDELDEIEVVEATEPTHDSALDLDFEADTDALAGDPERAAHDALTDTAFGRQVAEFTTTSSGEIVEEELPELEGVVDPGATADADVDDAEEALAIALGSAGDEPPAGAPPAETPAANFTEPAAAETLGGSSAVVDAADDTGILELPTDDVTAGGIEPAALGVVTDESLAGHAFDAEGDAVRMHTPGLADATPVLEGQAFTVDATAARDAAEPIGFPSEALGEQSFTAHGDAQPVEQPPVPQPPPARQDSPQGGGGGPGFIGTDLSSFIGGMPLVLPDLPPPPTGFGRVQVSFAGAKAPWEQAQRPSFPMGQGLAQEMMDAASGLRDVEEMEPEEIEPAPAGDEAFAGEADESIHDDGAPADEWNVAAAFDEDEDDLATDVSQDPSGDLSGVTSATATAPPAANESETQTRSADFTDGVADDADLLEAIESEPAADGAATISEDDLLEDLTEEPVGEAARPATAGEPAVDDELAVEEEAVEWTDEALDPVDEAPAELHEAAEELPDEPAAGAVAPPPVSAVPPLPPFAGEPAVDAPPLAGAPPRTGAIEEAVAELHLDADDAGGSVIDRTPAPAAVPPPPPRGKGAPAGLAAAGRATMPPPPARGKLPPRKGAAPAAGEDAAFASGTPGQVPTAFAGMTGVREADVFAQSSEDLADLGPADSSVFGTPVTDAAVPPTARRHTAPVGGGGNGDEPPRGNGDDAVALAQPGRRPAQRSIVPPRMGELGMSASAVEAMEAPQPEAVYRTIPKKNVARRVLIGVVVMILCMIVVVGAILYYLRPKLLTRGELHFSNMGALSIRERLDFQSKQEGKLIGRDVGLDARGQLAARAIEPGFVSDVQQLSRMRVEWPEGRLGTMVVSYEGTDPKDKERVFAMLNAMYLENASASDKETKLRGEIAALQKSIREFDEQTALRAEINRRLAKAPSPEELQQLEAKARSAENEYELALAAVKDAQLELRRVEEQMPAPSPGEAANRATNATPSGDAELAALHRAMEDASAKLATARSSASEEADAKRKMLDQAIELFQQAAAGVAKESPELAQYVQAVQQLQEKTHKLSGDLIQVQQQNHEKLSTWKKGLDEQVQARRNEVWAADTGLADLRAQLDLANRKYRAFVDQGYAEDSREVKAAQGEVAALNLQIDKRKETLGNDPIISKFTGELDELIAATKARLEVDRARIEKDIKEQEQAFARSNVVETLPNTQRKQAEALKAKQEAINDLRRQYAAALEKRSAESNAALRELEAQAGAIAARIDERKRLLASEGSKTLTQQQETARQAAIDQKQAAVKAAQQQQANALAHYVHSDKALREAMSRRDDQTTARRELEALDQALAGRKEQVEQDRLTLESRQDQVKNLITVDKPSEANVAQSANDNNRWLYAFGSVAALAVLFGLGLVVSVHGGDRHPRGEYVEAGPMAIPAIGDGAEEEAVESFTR